MGLAEKIEDGVDLALDDVFLGGLLVVDSIWLEEEVEGRCFNVEVGEWEALVMVWDAIADVEVEVELSQLPGKSLHWNQSQLETVQDMPQDSQSQSE